MDGEIRLGWEFGPIGASEFLEASPGDAFGLAIGRADVPDVAAFYLGEMEHFGECEVGFAETAAGDEDAKTGRGIKHFELVRAEAEDVFAGVTGWHKERPQMKLGETKTEQ